jgi:hypothetical protein
MLPDLIIAFSNGIENLNFLLPVEPGGVLENEQCG